MKLVLLTTETPHHAFYAREVHRRFPLRAVHLERACPAPPFPTAHPFERERDAHERAVLLDGRDGFAELCPTHSFESLNDAEATTALAEVAPEVVLVFGTGRLRTPTFRAARLACLNVHGGNPEEYRGLDSHLWAIYHRDWANLVTTLHHVDADLDTGDVVFQSALTIGRAARLHELRAINTRLCVDLTLLALEALASTGRLPARRQVRRGRYYSFMPAVLKDVCVGRFAQWTATLS